MSSVGPPPHTRLVLEGMALFMAPSSGGCCWLSVRRLAEITGLNKGTISKHRKKAVVAGWLIVGTNPRHRQSPTFWCAIPDGVELFCPRGTLRASGKTANPVIACSGPQDAFEKLSGRTVQSKGKPYVLKAETVRSRCTNRTPPPDQSSVNINNLGEASSNVLTSPIPSSGDECASEHLARERLDAWVRSDAFAQICTTCPGLVLKLTPPNCRVRGYESLVREALERTKKRTNASRHVGPQ